MLATACDIISEVKGAVRDGSPTRRVEILRQISGLFASDAARLSERQIAIFDEIMLCLLERIETPTLSQLGVLLAGVPSGPREVTRRLACHEEASVAGPILQNSLSLPAADLIEIASCGSRQHQLAIAARKRLEPELTDALLLRAERDVCLALASNPGARFSEPGYMRLAARAESDGEIADLLARRSDAPAAARQPRAAIDYSEAKALVLALNNDGKLADQTVNRFAVRQEQQNLVAALALLATVETETIEPLFDRADGYGLMIACRASRLNWNTTRAILTHRKRAARLAPHDVERRREAFEALALSIAQWTIRFGAPATFAAKLALPESASDAAGGTS